MATEKYNWDLMIDNSIKGYQRITDVKIEEE
jgi:hypothetical protein